MPSESPEPPRRPRVLVDTNGWFLPARSGTDLFGEIERLLPGAEIRVPTPVLRELEGLASRRVEGASVALGLARRAVGLRCGGSGDDAVLSAATRSGDWVLTGDRRLSERLRAAGVSVIVPRDRTRLVAHAAPPEKRATARNSPRRSSA
ncbi:MAG: DNA-binding protein [Thermoplasmata archaeon]|nr:DNA-binding protein [Thermoplasmata archaeon]